MWLFTLERNGGPERFTHWAWVAQLGGNSQTPNPRGVLRSETSWLGKTPAEARLGLRGGKRRGMSGLQGRLGAAPTSGISCQSSRPLAPAGRWACEGGCDQRREMLLACPASLKAPALPQGPRGLSAARVPCSGAIRWREL